ncbi:MAG: hypothetical protein EA385_12930 [Salinarimonadaceae bacterium]|nr:MAG: hypothetical protein EA385_12930 [Salinarimonadaceae bacterium]
MTARANTAGPATSTPQKSGGLLIFWRLREESAMSDLIHNLRSMARHEHADLSVADEAADEIERLRKERDEAREALEAVDTWVTGLGMYRESAEHEPATVFQHVRLVLGRRAPQEKPDG